MHPSMIFSPRPPSRVSRTWRYPTSSACPPQHRMCPLPPRHALPCSTAVLVSRLCSLAHGRPPHCVTLRIASAQYDGLHPAETVWCARRSKGTRTRAECGMRTRGQSLGALGNTRAELEVLDLSLEGTSDEVSHQALYKQIGSLLPNVQALRTLRLQASLPTEAAIADEGPSRLALWTRPPLGLALRSFLCGRIWNLSGSMHELNSCMLSFWMFPLCAYLPFAHYELIFFSMERRVRVSV
ncbi:hypothetical protein EDB89DRAFT_378211 [Lactarius sanguifluus]|nr:hypothetical protein EDB89DRAFT_378211 [Lactarius sanguifluus]